ncbi:MAG: HD domain-containing protein [Clostridiaceae bacterium]|nr:HD domain-containing protein [Clostridiaceae bacterium]
MENVYINKKDTSTLEKAIDATRLSLLAKKGSTEIMSQTLISGATVWLVPADEPETMEFFFIHKGEIELTLDAETIRLVPGDSFYVENLKREILLKTHQDTQLLYITNAPLFDSVFGFQDDLTKLLVRINDKDDYTFRHSRNVMRYSVKLFESMPEYCTNVSLNDIVVASLFHDVGKCFVPDEILKKSGKLDASEMRYIMRHPIDSARLLRPHFGDRVAEIAQNHHERLDGTGYPFNLTAEDIIPEARIVAVADVFDAMTTNRGYNIVKSYEEGARELLSLPKQFDRKITGMLAELVRMNAFAEEYNEKA